MACPQFGKAGWLEAFQSRSHICLLQAVCVLSGARRYFRPWGRLANVYRIQEQWTLCALALLAHQNHLYISVTAFRYDLFTLSAFIPTTAKKKSFTFFLVFPLRLAVVIRLESSTYPLHERSLFETLRVGTFRESSCRLVC